MQENDNVEGEIGDKVQGRVRHISDYLNLHPCAKGRVYRYYEDLWQRVKTFWLTEEDPIKAKNMKLSFEAFYAVIRILTSEPQNTEDIMKKSYLSYSGVSKVLRTIRLLDEVRWCRDIRMNARFMVYWIVKKDSV